MPKICIIFNPTAQGDQALRFRRVLDSSAGQWSLKPTDAPGAARRLAREAVLEGFETIAAAGGDGTVNEVLNGITDAPEGWDRCRLAVLPLGTANVFAKELGLPLDLKSALALLTGGRTRVIDLPSAEYPGAAGQERRRFAQLAGAGLDARAIARVSWNLKRRFGPFAYVIAGFSALREKLPALCVTTEERSSNGELVLVGNGRFYGGRFRVFPQANLEDGRLDVVVFPRASWGTLLRFGLGWSMGNIHRYSGAHVWQSQNVSIACDVPMPFELDGDNAGHLPASFSLEPRRMRVLVSGE